MKGFTITFEGIHEVKTKVIYKGVECIYHDRGNNEVWLQPLNPSDNIGNFAGQGKAITKQEFENIINKA